MKKQFSILLLCTVIPASLLFISCEELFLGPGIETPLPKVYDSAFLTMLDSLRYAIDMPALGAAIVTDSGIIEAGAVGSRRYGGPLNVTDDDKFNLGSCTKAFTAMLMGHLVDLGVLTWQTTILDVFPEYASEMRQEYKDVTVLNLLTHSAGFRRDPEFSLRTDRSKDPVEQRRAVVEWAVKQPPVRTRGQSLYSNLGFIIAGAMAEKLTGTSYEKLMFSIVLPPLGIKKADICITGTYGLEDEPLQHTGSHGVILPAPDACLHPIYRPAGMLTMSVKEWAKYIMWVLQAENGTQTILKPETARTLLTAVSRTEYYSDWYAPGWAVTSRSWAGGRTLTHSGSNNVNYVEAWVAPKKHFAIIAATNQGCAAASAPVDAVCSRLITYYLNR